MKILQINSVCGVGSTGRIATDLHGIFVSLKHQSKVAFGRDVAKNCKHTIRIGNCIDNYLHVARTRLFDTHGFGSAHATKEFIAKIEEFGPDVIHLHNLHGYYIHIGKLFDYLKQARKPIIWTLHDCWAFTGHCSYFDFIGCEHWKHLCYKCPLKHDYPKSLFFDRSQRNYQQKKVLFTGVKGLRIITPSKWLERLVNASFLKEYPVSLIHNGIDLKVFTPNQCDFRKRYSLERQFVILGVASVWEVRKGYRYFIDLAKQLHSDEKIILVGVNEQYIKQLPPGIIGISKIESTSELAEIYSTADVYINPTLEDNFPTTNIEALACGTPVITFNSGGSPECLDDSCGVVVNRGDLQGLIDAIAMVRRNGKESYTVHCRRRACGFYDKNDRLAEYIALYESMLKSQGNYSC